jgi:Fatty acid cis/trans isomerase (CTI)
MRNLLLFSVLFLLAGCAAYTHYQLDQHHGIEDPTRFDHPLTNSTAVSYQRDVKPITDSRCVVCHGCFDAPCQLQMGSYEGITRGASKNKIYDDLRMSLMAPSRLFTDGKNTAEWRSKAFYPVLNERNSNAVANREASVMAKMLALKREHPFPKTGLLSNESFDVSINREQSCPAIEEFDQYADEHPEGGMPYGLPGLSNKEQQTLLNWLEAGAPVESQQPVTQAQLEQAAQWEAFLNGDSLKLQ